MNAYTHSKQNKTKNTNMPRKKKLDIESAQAVEASNEEKIGASKELESEEKELETIEKAKEDIIEEEKKEEVKEEVSEARAEEKAEEKTEKRRTRKKLSESELKKVMTDTKETLIPLTDYIACSIHLGTKVITPDMRKYVYKRRADGLAVLNTSLIDDKLREAAKFLANFAAEDIFITCKRESNWLAVEKFAQATGIRCFTKKYPAGIITNIRLDTFFEPKLAIVCDPWVDKNALHDALLIKIPVLGICDANNYTKGITQVVVGNNKSRKSLGCILFIIAREYLKNIGKDDEAKELKLEDFAGKLEEVQVQTGESAEFEGEGRERRRKAPEILATGEATEVSEAVAEGV